MKKLPFAAFVAAALVMGCSSDKEVSYDNPPIGLLVSSDHQITIHTGPEGPLYSVKGLDGKQLAKEISKEELQASFPNLNLNALWAGQETGEFDSSGIDALNTRGSPELFPVVPKTMRR